MGKRHRGTRLVGTLLVALGIPTAALALPPSWRDQGVDAAADGSTAINDRCRFVAQTYTARKTGWLRAIAVHVVSDSRHALRVTIREVRGGVPTRVVWSASTVRAGATALTHPIALTPPTPQIPGRRYAIVVEYPSARPAGPHRSEGDWEGATGNRYAGGEALCSADDTHWEPVLVGLDLRFQTYVQQPPRAAEREACAVARAK